MSLTPAGRRPPLSGWRLEFSPSHLPSQSRTSDLGARTGCAQGGHRDVLPLSPSLTGGGAGALRVPGPHSQPPLPGWKGGTLEKARSSRIHKPVCAGSPGALAAAGFPASLPPSLPLLGTGFGAGRLLADSLPGSRTVWQKPASPRPLQKQCRYYYF